MPSLSFLVLAVLFSLFSSVASAQSITTLNVTASEYQYSLHRIGKLDHKRTTNLSFKSAGYLKELNVDEGQFFKKGDILASLDTLELKAEKNARYAALLNAKREVNRIRKLIEQKLSSEQALDNAMTQVELTRAAYRVAYYNLEKAQIVAPFDGVVVVRNSELNELQSPQLIAFNVAASENNWIVRVSLTGAEVAQLDANHAVEVMVEGIGTSSGRISKIPAKSLSNGLFEVEILLTNITQEFRLIAGQVAAVAMNFHQPQLVYQVPIDALVAMTPAGEATIYTKDNTTGEIQPQHFSVYQLDNQYLYLSAIDVDSLDVIVKGWQLINSPK